MIPLQKAIVDRDLDKIKEILINEPSKIDDLDENGCCMALLAALSGDFAIVRYVVEYSRASMNIYDPKHRNILHYGVMSKSMDVVKYLVEKVGMDPLVGDIDLITPMDIAARENMQEIMEYFKSLYGVGIDGMYRNPIRTGMYPDPSIVRVGNDYYMVNSSFVFFPCIPISHSTDLVNWEIIGHAVTNPEYVNLDELEGGRGFWAPDISYHNGKFYIAATYRLNDTGTVYRKQFVMSSDRPEGPYSKPAVIDEDGIDPSIFVDDDGKKYMLLNRGARIFELNEDCTKQISEAELLFYGDNKRAPEGPHLLKKDGYYYLFEAEGGTGPGHRITVSRSKTLKGRYEPCPYNPIMRQTDEQAAIQRCGHGKPVMTQNGQWYMVYLCGRMVEGKYSILGRETALDPITWTADGWPIVNNLNGPGTLNIKPELPAMKMANYDRDEFEGGRLKCIWMHPRAPKDGQIAVCDGKLSIRADKFDLDDTRCRSIVVRRQNDFEFACTSHLINVKITDGCDVGLTCYYDENTYLKYGVFGRNGQILLEVEERIDTEVKKSFTTVLEPCEDIYLSIDTKYLVREFSYSYDGVNFNKIGTLDNVYYLCDEGIKKGKRFTGAMVGMYAHCQGEDLTAEFDYFEYKKKGDI